MLIFHNVQHSTSVSSLQAWQPVKDSMPPRILQMQLKRGILEGGRGWNNPRGLW